MRRGMASKGYDSWFHHNHHSQRFGGSSASLGRNHRIGAHGAWSQAEMSVRSSRGQIQATSCHMLASHELGSHLTHLTVILRHGTGKVPGASRHTGIGREPRVQGLEEISHPLLLGLGSQFPISRLNAVLLQGDGSRYLEKINRGSLWRFRSDQYLITDTGP